MSQVIKVRTQDVLDKAEQVFGPDLIEHERKSIRTRLSSDRVIASDKLSLDRAVTAELVNLLHRRLEEVEREKALLEAAFLSYIRTHSAGEWIPDHVKVVDWAYKALTGKNEHFRQQVLNAGITPEIAQKIIVATHEFVINDIEPFSENHEEGLMDWRYLFEYARFLKGTFKDFGLDTDMISQSAAQALKPFVCVFDSAIRNYEKAYTADTFGDYDQSFLEFLDKWDAVQYALGEDPFDKAVANAHQHPIELKNERTGVAAVTLIASVAFHLQLLAGPGQPILLPTERVGKIFGKTGDAGRQMGSRLVRAFRKTGLLSEVKAEWNHKKGEAKEYCFLLESEVYVPPTSYVTQVRQLPQSHRFSQVL